MEALKVKQSGELAATESMVEEYRDYLNAKEFPCIAAKAALAKQQISCMVAGHMACPADDMAILEFIYSFVDEYRCSGSLYHSAAVIFTNPGMLTESEFDDLLWQRLQSLSNLDSMRYGYDKRVNKDPSSPNFSFSLKQEAFFIIGLHPGSSRAVRQFAYPALVFNPHQQFEQLRETEKYRHLKYAVRKRDVAFSGSVNPMLEDFGDSSEVYQYSGKKYNNQWRCPLKINHEQSSHNSAA